MATHAPVPSTSDILLRNVTEGDLPILFEQQMDPEANRMAAFPARDRDAFMTHWAKILSDASTIKKTILFEGQIAGNIGIFEQSGRTLVGYWIGKQYWGKGIATKALSALLDQVETRPLYAYVARHNLGSIRVLEKCGFAICDEGEVAADEGGRTSKRSFWCSEEREEAAGPNRSKDRRSSRAERLHAFFALSTAAVASI